MTRTVTRIAAGVDGCRAGWIQITLGPQSAIVSRCLPDAAGLVRQEPRPDAIAIDIPIGLPASGPRACDLEARRLLGPRRSSVFSAPLRAMLEARSWEEACAIRSRIEGKRIPKQLWGILPKIREVDALLRADLHGAGGLLREAHPELCFRSWAGRPLEHAKKRPAGRRERLALVSRHFGAKAFERVREAHPRRDVADDDILDAFAALWTAERILAGSAHTLPEHPPRDACGLPMQIVC